jgi:hypothetical protein
MCFCVAVAGFLLMISDCKNGINNENNKTKQEGRTH